MSENNKKRQYADIPSQLDDPADKGLYYQAVNEWKLEFEDLEHFLEWKQHCENGNSDTESEVATEEVDSEEEGPQEDEQWDYGDADPQTVLDCGQYSIEDGDDGQSFGYSHRSSTPARSDRGEYSGSSYTGPGRSGGARPIQRAYVPSYGRPAGQPSEDRRDYNRSVRPREGATRQTYGYRTRNNSSFYNKPYQPPRQNYGTPYRY